MSKNEIKATASPMPGCPAWTIAVFKAEDMPEGTEVFPAAPVQAQEPVAAAISYWKGPTNSNGTPRECGDANIGRWLDYEPTTLKHGMAIKDRGDPDKRVKFLFDATPVHPVAVPDPLYQAMHDFRDDVLSGINGLDNDQINAVLSTFDNYMLDDPAAPAELQGVATRIGVSTGPSDDGKTIAVVGMAVQEGVSFVFYTGNHSITQDTSGFVDINFQRLMEK